MSDFFWLNPPQEVHIGETIRFRTMPDTDFWQRTHYGIRRHTGHCYLTGLQSDWKIQAKFEWIPNMQYDQCGLIAICDEENWIKVSTEYEDASLSRLGSVVTSLGYSDWASSEVELSRGGMQYRMTKTGNDFTIESSADGIGWSLMRIAHLHRLTETMKVGVYGCSPKDGGFPLEVSELKIEEFPL